jgi:uncharacterized membrane protein
MSKESRELRLVPRWIAIGVTTVVMIQVIYGLVLWRTIPQAINRGVFGDAFGALNTLFTGLVVPGALIAIYIQMRDSRESRMEQEETLKATQRQVELLQAQVDRQERRDRVNAGPFFLLRSNSISGLRLELELRNVGAPVICLDFKCLTPGNVVQSWYPSTLSEGVNFRAPTNLLGSNPEELKYAMTLRDRWGETRVFDLTVRLRPGPATLDFEEGDLELAEERDRGQDLISRLRDLESAPE